MKELSYYIQSIVLQTTSTYNLKLRETSEHQNQNLQLNVLLSDLAHKTRNFRALEGSAEKLDHPLCSRRKESYAVIEYEG
jgi:hypothetical protein